MQSRSVAVGTCPNISGTGLCGDCQVDGLAHAVGTIVGGDARQWGRGKLDAEAGMRYLLRRINSCDISGDGLVDVTDINIIINVMLGKDSTFKTEEVDANRDGQVDISDVNKVIDVMLGLKDDLSYTRTNVR